MGLIFIGVGYVMAFAGRIDFSEILFLGGTFLLPLPVSVVALWFPRIAGSTLLAWVPFSLLTVGVIVISHHQFPWADYTRFILTTTAFNIPHLLFGIAYRRVAANADDVAP